MGPTNAGRVGTRATGMRPTADKRMYTGVPPNAVFVTPAGESQTEPPAAATVAEALGSPSHFVNKPRHHGNEKTPRTPGDDNCTSGHQTAEGVDETTTTPDARCRAACANVERIPRRVGMKT